MSKKGKSPVSDYFCSFYSKCDVKCNTSTSGLTTTTSCSYSTVSKLRPSRSISSEELLEVSHNNIAIESPMRSQIIPEVQSSQAKDQSNGIAWTNSEVNSAALLADLTTRLYTKEKLGYSIGLFSKDRLMKEKINNIEKFAKKAITNGNMAYGKVTYENQIRDVSFEPNTSLESTYVEKTARINR